MKTEKLRAAMLAYAAMLDKVREEGHRIEDEHGISIITGVVGHTGEIHVQDVRTLGPTTPITTEPLDPKGYQYTAQCSFVCDGVKYFSLHHTEVNDGK